MMLPSFGSFSCLWGGVGLSLSGGEGVGGEGWEGGSESYGTPDGYDRLLRIEQVCPSWDVGTGHFPGRLEVVG